MSTKIADELSLHLPDDINEEVPPHLLNGHMSSPRPVIETCLNGHVSSPRPVIETCEECKRIQQEDASCQSCHLTSAGHCQKHCSGHVCKTCETEKVTICPKCRNAGHCTHNCKQICEVCREREKYWERCSFCGGLLHCMHHCELRETALLQVKGNVCQECENEWLICRFCYMRKHCLHECESRNEAAGLGKVCRQCKIYKKWCKCNYCRKKDHCIDKCDAFQAKFGEPRITFLLIGLILYLFEVGSDIVLVLGYFESNNQIWGSLTLIFILVPGLAMSVYSFYLWFTDDSTWNEDKLWLMLIKVLLTTLLLAPLAWMIEMIYYWKTLRDIYIYTNKEKSKSYFYRKSSVNADDDYEYYGHREGAWMWQLQESNVSHIDSEYEDNTKSLVEFTKRYDKNNEYLYKTQLFEAFIENAPQMVLQLYITSLKGFGELNINIARQWFSIVTSWVSLSWIMVNFYTCLHPNISYFVLVKILVMFPAHMFTIGARVLAMALFASVYHGWILVWGAIHTFIMLIFQIIVKPDRSATNVVIDFLLSFIYMFCFNPKMTFMKQKPFINGTRKHYFIYFTFAYIMNIILVTLWLSGKSKELEREGSSTHLPSILNSTQYGETNMPETEYWVRLSVTPPMEQTNATTSTNKDVGQNLGDITQKSPKPIYPELFDIESSASGSALPQWFQITATLFIFVGFFIGIAFMMLYYKWFHHQIKYKPSMFSDTLNSTILSALPTPRPGMLTPRPDGDTQLPKLPKY